MIIIALLNAFFGDCNAIIKALNIPNIPDSVVNVIKQVTDYIYSGRCLINYFIDGNLINVSVVIFTSVLTFFFIFDFVMWILKKIPFASIS